MAPAVGTDEHAVPDRVAPAISRRSGWCGVASAWTRRRRAQPRRRTDHRNSAGPSPTSGRATGWWTRCSSRLPRTVWTVLPTRSRPAKTSGSTRALVDLTLFGAELSVLLLRLLPRAPASAGRQARNGHDRRARLLVVTSPGIAVIALLVRVVRGKTSLVGSPTTPLQGQPHHRGARRRRVAVPWYDRAMADPTPEHAGLQRVEADGPEYRTDGRSRSISGHSYCNCDPGRPVWIGRPLKSDARSALNRGPG